MLKNIKYDSVVFDSCRTNLWTINTIEENFQNKKNRIFCSLRSHLNEKLSQKLLDKSRELLKQEKIDEDFNDIFRSIDHAGRRIIRTVDLILNMSELQSGTYEYISKPLNIYEEILYFLYSEYKHIANEKNIELEIIKKTDLIV